MKTILKAIAVAALLLGFVLLYFSEPTDPEASLLEIAIPKAVAFLCLLGLSKIYTGYWRPSKARQ